MTPEVRIPADLLPSDGRFGSGPSRVRDSQVRALVAAQPDLLGTSHRQAPVRSLVGDVRRMLAELFSAPEGYEVVLGNGGSTMFWDVATFCLVDRVAEHGSFGEFGSKFAAGTNAAPFLDASIVRSAQPGAVAVPIGGEADVYAWPHNETSTGAMAPVKRPDGDGLTLIDATSGAGGLPVDLAQADAYYFAPQKSFGSDGGLWFALLSPAAMERARRIEEHRWVPASLSLTAAIDNSLKDQTLNTPAVATLVMMRAQLEWMLGIGGLAATAARSEESSAHLYNWAEDRDWARPFVARPEDRSSVVVTIDLDESVSSDALRRQLRANGIVDVDPYRKLGRNQLRVGVFPGVSPDDVRALTACIDYVVERMAS